MKKQTNFYKTVENFSVVNLWELVTSGKLDSSDIENHELNSFKEDSKKLSSHL